MENIIIEIDKDINNYFTVRQGDRYNDKLTYDEMLGLISALTMPKERPCLHWMRTEEEWRLWFSRITSSKESAH
jgi:hypothetical protein